MTASLATSKQILHSKAALLLDSSGSSLLPLLFVSVAVAPILSVLLLPELHETLILLVESFSRILGIAPPLSSCFTAPSLVVCL